MSFNAHGDVTQLTSSTGAVVKDYHYDAFGEEKSLAPGDQNPFRYCGEYYDQETGNYYLRARYYAPGVGRFTQEDTYQGDYRDPLSLNRYSYGRNNPIWYRDPSGHMFEATLAHAQNTWWLTGADGPYPVGDAVFVAGVGVMFIGEAVVIFGTFLVTQLLLDQHSAGFGGGAASSFAGAGRAEVLGKHMIPAKNRSDNVDWNADSNKINHILKGTENGHVEGWKKFGIDPNDPKSFGPLLPFIKEAVDKGKESIEQWGPKLTDVLLKYTYTLPEDGMKMVVKLFVDANGAKRISDAWVVLP